jgi:hypothetical protein
MSSKPKDSLWQLIVAFLQAIGLMKRPTPYPPPPVPPVPPPLPPPNEDAPDFLGFWCERGTYFVKGERTTLLTSYFTSACPPDIGEYGIRDNGTGPYDAAIAIGPADRPGTERVYRDNGPACEREFRPSGEFYWYPGEERPWNMASARRVSSPKGCDPVPPYVPPPPPEQLTPYVIEVTVRNRYGRTKRFVVRTQVDLSKTCA